jgi:hypothetical protein
MDRGKPCIWRGDILSHLQSTGIGSVTFCPSPGLCKGEMCQKLVDWGPDRNRGWMKSNTSSYLGPWQVLASNGRGRQPAAAGPGLWLLGLLHGGRFQHWGWAWDLRCYSSFTSPLHLWLNHCRRHLSIANSDCPMSASLSLYLILVLMCCSCQFSPSPPSFNSTTTSLSPLMQPW